MPTLSCFFAVYTDGVAPKSGLVTPRGMTASLSELSQIVMPGPETELFGPHAAGLAKLKPKRCFLLAMQRETKGSAGNFFADAHALMLSTFKGLPGWGLDVLRLWPYPLSEVDDMPDDPFAEDLFSVGFHEQGEHGFRAETFGLSKLGQRELSFAFRGRELIDDAALLCAHLADYAMSQVRRVEHEQTMSFGFDQLKFVAAEGSSGSPTIRGWHPELVRQMLPEALFPGVGVLEVMGYDSPNGQARPDVSAALQRAYEQRMVLEELDLSGDSPHQAATAMRCECLGKSHMLVAERKDPQTVRDSGWACTCGKPHERKELVATTLGAITEAYPQLLKYLALPSGSRLVIEDGKPRVDISRAKRDDDGDTLA